MDGFCLKRNCESYVTRTIAPPRVEFFREGSASAEGYDCGPGKSYLAMADDRQQQVDTGWNLHQCTPIQIQVR